MGTLSIRNNFEVDAVDGSLVTGKQGAATNGINQPFDMTVTGNVHKLAGTLADDSEVTLWDDDDDSPTGFDYFFICPSEDAVLQLIASGSEVKIPLLANVPFVLATGTLLATAGTTAMTAEPTLTDIDSIILGNYSGSSMTYSGAVID